MSPREKTVYDVAVVSADRDLCDLMNLLLSEAGYSSVSANETAPAARLIIINLDDSSSVVHSQPAARGHGIVGVSASENELPEAVKSKCLAVLHRPFSFAEFRETVKTAYDNVGRQSVKTVRISGALNLELDASKRCVLYDGKSTQLTPNEFAFLTRLSEKRGEAVSRSELSSLILDGAGEVRSNETDVYICTLRRKIEKSTGTRLIYTVRGKGYMIK
jgi:DNA-binding response OmpR family regulator